MSAEASHGGLSADSKKLSSDKGEKPKKVEGGVVVVIDEDDPNVEESRAAGGGGDGGRGESGGGGESGAGGGSGGSGEGGGSASKPVDIDSGPGDTARARGGKRKSPTPEPEQEDEYYGVQRRRLAAEIFRVMDAQGEIVAAKMLSQQGVHVFCDEKALAGIRTTSYMTGIPTFWSRAMCMGDDFFDGVCRIMKMCAALDGTQDYIKEQVFRYSEDKGALWDTLTNVTETRPPADVEQRVALEMLSLQESKKADRYYIDLLGNRIKSRIHSTLLRDDIDSVLNSSSSCKGQMIPWLTEEIIKNSRVWDALQNSGYFAGDRGGPDAGAVIAAEMIMGQLLGASFWTKEISKDSGLQECVRTVQAQVTMFLSRVDELKEAISEIIYSIQTNNPVFREFVLTADRKVALLRVATYLLDVEMRGVIRIAVQNSPGNSQLRGVCVALGLYAPLYEIVVSNKQLNIYATHIAMNVHDTATRLALLCKSLYVFLNDVMKLLEYTMVPYPAAVSPYVPAFAVEVLMEALVRCDGYLVYLSSIQGLDNIPLGEMGGYNTDEIRFLGATNGIRVYVRSALERRRRLVLARMIADAMSGADGGGLVPPQRQKAVREFVLNITVPWWKDEHLGCEGPDCTRFPLTVPLFAKALLEADDDQFARIPTSNMIASVEDDGLGNAFSEDMEGPRAQFLSGVSFLFDSLSLVEIPVVWRLVGADRARAVYDVNSLLRYETSLWERMAGEGNNWISDAREEYIQAGTPVMEELAMKRGVDKRAIDSIVKQAFSVERPRGRLEAGAKVGDKGKVAEGAAGAGGLVGKPVHEGPKRAFGTRSRSPHVDVPGSKPPTGGEAQGRASRGVTPPVEPPGKSASRSTTPEGGRKATRSAGGPLVREDPRMGLKNVMSKEDKAAAAAAAADAAAAALAREEAEKAEKARKEGAAAAEEQAKKAEQARRDAAAAAEEDAKKADKARKEGAAAAEEGAKLAEKARKDGAAAAEEGAKLAEKAREEGAAAAEEGAKLAEKARKDGAAAVAAKEDAKKAEKVEKVKPFHKNTTDRMNKMAEINTIFLAEGLSSKADGKFDLVWRYKMASRNAEWDRRVQLVGPLRKGVGAIASVSLGDCLSHDSRVSGKGVQGRFLSNRNKLPLDGLSFLVYLQEYGRDGNLDIHARDTVTFWLELYAHNIYEYGKHWCKGLSYQYPDFNDVITIDDHVELCLEIVDKLTTAIKGAKGNGSPYHPLAAFDSFHAATIQFVTENIAHSLALREFDIPEIDPVVDEIDYFRSEVEAQKLCEANTLFLQFYTSGAPEAAGGTGTYQADPVDILSDLWSAISERSERVTNLSKAVKRAVIAYANEYQAVLRRESGYQGGFPLLGTMDLECMLKSYPAKLCLLKDLLLGTEVRDTVRLSVISQRAHDEASSVLVKMFAMDAARLRFSVHKQAFLTDDKEKRYISTGLDVSTLDRTLRFGKSFAREADKDKSGGESTESDCEESEKEVDDAGGEGRGRPKERKGGKKGRASSEGAKKEGTKEKKAPRGSSEGASGEGSSGRRPRGKGALTARERSIRAQGKLMCFVKQEPPKTRKSLRDDLSSTDDDEKDRTQGLSRVVVRFQKNTNAQTNAHKRFSNKEVRWFNWQKHFREGVHGDLLNYGIIPPASAKVKHSSPDDVALELLHMRRKRSPFTDAGLGVALPQQCKDGKYVLPYQLLRFLNTPALGSLTSGKYIFLPVVGWCILTITDCPKETFFSDIMWTLMLSNEVQLAIHKVLYNQLTLYSFHTKEDQVHGLVTSALSRVPANTFIGVLWNTVLKGCDKGGKIKYHRDRDSSIFGGKVDLTTPNPLIPYVSEEMRSGMSTHLCPSYLDTFREKNTAPLRVYWAPACKCNANVCIERLPETIVHLDGHDVLAPVYGIKTTKPLQPGHSILLDIEHWHQMSTDDPARFKGGVKDNLQSQGYKPFQQDEEIEYDDWMQDMSFDAGTLKSMCRECQKTYKERSYVNFHSLGTPSDPIIFHGGSRTTAYVNGGTMPGKHPVTKYMEQDISEYINAHLYTGRWLRFPDCVVPVPLDALAVCWRGHEDGVPYSRLQSFDLLMHPTVGLHLNSKMLPSHKTLADLPVLSEQAMKEKLECLVEEGLWYSPHDDDKDKLKRFLELRRNIQLREGGNGAFWVHLDKDGNVVNPCGAGSTSALDEHDYIDLDKARESAEDKPAGDGGAAARKPEKKVEAPKEKEGAKEAPKVEAPKVEAPKPPEKKVEPPKAEPPKAEAPKVEPPKAEPPKAEPPKAEPPKVEAPKAEPPKVEAKEPDAPKPPEKSKEGARTKEDEDRENEILAVLGRFFRYSRHARAQTKDLNDGHLTAKNVRFFITSYSQDLETLADGLRVCLDIAGRTMDHVHMQLSYGRETASLRREMTDVNKVMEWAQLFVSVFPDTQCEDEGDAYGLVQQTIQSSERLESMWEIFKAGPSSPGGFGGDGGCCGGGDGGVGR